MITLRIKRFIFFGFLIGCVQKESYDPVEIIWRDNKAVEITLRNPSVIDLPEEKLSTTLKVELGDTGEQMLGEFFKRDGKVIFQPIVPFTRGLHYHILANDIIFSELNIPIDENAKAPVVSIFPSSDTVPENILKMYLRFSEPMVEGKSLRHICVFNSNGDTLKGTFLDLQPELWNDEGTMLTLWFDPGRVKRDLIPNQELGNPLIENHQYKLVVSADWKSKSGVELGIQTSKKFWVIGRDEKIPNISSWKIKLPSGNTSGEMVINFPESLDYSLIQSAIHILTESGNLVPGVITPLKNENAIFFKPDQQWNNGNYILQVESRLEDLAGNNLVRPFDRDITKDELPSEKKYFEKGFTLK